MKVCRIPVAAASAKSGGEGAAAAEEEVVDAASGAARVLFHVKLTCGSASGKQAARVALASRGKRVAARRRSSGGASIDIIGRGMAARVTAMRAWSSRGVRRW